MCIPPSSRTRQIHSLPVPRRLQRERGGVLPQPRLHLLLHQPLLGAPQRGLQLLDPLPVPPVQQLVQRPLQLDRADPAVVLRARRFLLVTVFVSGAPPEIAAAKSAAVAQLDELVARRLNPIVCLA